MSQGSITPSSSYIFCVPPHTHALLRYRVHSVTASHVSYFAESGVAVDRLTGAVLEGVEGEDGAIRIVPRTNIDMERAWEGVAPESPTYYSSFAAFQRLQELALIRYGTDPVLEDDALYELEVLRQRMMDAHPDRGGSEAAFTKARDAYDAARRRARG